MALTTEEYETLAMNVADVLRWIREAEARLRYYRGDADNPLSPVTETIDE